MMAGMLLDSGRHNGQNGSLSSGFLPPRMSKCLNLTRAGEYAVTALARLALESERSGAGPVPVEVLADDRKIPRSFLTKILTQCAKRGLVTAKKGPAGGVALAKPASEISLLDIVEACDGDLARQACVFFPQRACPGADCEVYCPLRREEERVRERLRAVPLMAMARALRVHPDAPTVRKLQGRQRWKAR